MERKIMVAAMFLMIVGFQTMCAQKHSSVNKGKAKVVLYVAGNKAYECNTSQLDSIVFIEEQLNQEITVTVDANGNADGGHRVSRIDDTNFYIDEVKYTIKDGNLVVSGYDPIFFTGTAIIISKLIYNGRTLNVTSIDDKIFYNCSSLTTLTISEGVTSIGNYAFHGCSSLTSVVIPNSVLDIGCCAFQESGLTSLTIGSGVTNISQQAFSFCYKLISVRLESNAIVSASRDEDFSLSNIFGDQVQEYVIGDAVTSIGQCAFHHCRSLVSMTISNSVTSIGYEAFWGCKSLTSVTIPESVTSIGPEAFRYCI